MSRRIAMQTSRIAACALLVLAAACSQQGSLGDSQPAGTAPTGGPDNSIVVSDTNENQSAKDYACGPLGYREAGNLLVGLGVVIKIDPLEIPLPVAGMNNNNNNNNNNNDPNAAKPGDAQVAYLAAKSSFGVADYANRMPEATQVGTAQLAKMGDLFIQAAPEILAGFSTSPRCGGVTLVDANLHFTREGLSCIGGQVVNDDQVQLAGQLIDRAVAQGMTQQGAQELVVAGFLSAQFTCR